MAGNIPPPPPGYTLQPLGGPPPPPKGYTLQTPAAASSSTPAPTAEPQKGVLGRVWDALVTPSGATTGGRFKMGLGDPAYGAAQMGAHMADVPLMSPEMPIVPAGQEPARDYGKQLDTMVQGRERQYEEQRRQATPGINDPEVGMTPPKLAMDWARLVGNVASPVNVAEAAAVPGGGVAGRGIPLATRLLNAARVGGTAGAIGGASQPVTGGDFATEKAKQIAAGAATGAAIAPAATATGAGARALLGRPAAATADQAITQGFAKGVGIPSKGIQNAPDLANAQANAASAVRSIVANKDNLTLTGPRGTEITGQLPRTRGQFAEAVNQTKESLFKQFDKLAKQADTSTTAPQPIDKFQTALQDAVRREQKARVDLAGYAEAVKTQAGKSQGTVDADLRMAGRAQRELRQAVADREAAQRNLSRPWVDLKPVASELLNFASQAEARLGPAGKAGVSHALEMAKDYGQQEVLTGSQAQRLIKQFNASLKAFYDNPSYDTAARASIDAMVANKLRQGLDDMVGRATGAAYQGLKNQYGALSAIEKQVTKGALKGINKLDDTFMDRFVNVTSAEELLRGLVTLDPRALARGGLLRLAKWGEQKLNSPDRAIANMFSGAERSIRPQIPARAGLRAALPATAAASAAARATSDLPGADEHVVPAPGAP